MDTPVDEKMVNHPSHYVSGGMEVIDVIEAFDLLRAGKKGDIEEDLCKAIWYIRRALEKKKR